MANSRQRARYIRNVHNAVLNNERRRFEDTSLFLDELNKEIDKNLNRLRDDYRKLAMRQRNELAQGNGADPGLAYRMGWTSELGNNLKAMRDSIVNTTVDGSMKHFIDTYHKTYDNNIKAFELGGAFAVPDKRAIVEAINYPWSGTMWSDRVWINTNKVTEEIRQSITGALIRGDSSVNVAKEIDRSLIKQGQKIKYVTERIVRTETARVRYTADDRFYKEVGVEELEFCAIIDHKTSEACRGYDGKVFKYGSQPPIPIHPHCRSTYLPVIPNKSIEEWKEEIRQAKEIDNPTPIPPPKEDKPKKKSTPKEKKVKSKEVRREAEPRLFKTKKEALDYQKKVLSNKYSVAHLNSKENDRATYDKYLKRVFGDDLSKLDKTTKGYKDYKEAMDLWDKAKANPDKYIIEGYYGTKKKFKFEGLEDFTGVKTERSYEYSLPRIFEIRQNGRYFLNVGTKQSAKDMEYMTNVIEKCIELNPKLEGIKVAIDNAEVGKAGSRSSTVLGFYQNQIDVVFMRDLKSYEKVSKTITMFEDTFSHELGHRLHSKNPLHAEYNIALTEEAWSSWKSDIDGFYDKYRVNKNYFGNYSNNRMNYPVNAEDYYRSGGDKTPYYQEMWAETHSIYTTGNQSDRENLEKYFPGMMDKLAEKLK